VWAPESTRSASFFNYALQSLTLKIGPIWLLDNGVPNTHICTMIPAKDNSTRLTVLQPMIQDLKMDSQRWQQERQPGEAGRGGSHSPHVRSSKVSRGPDASLVAYQDSRTHAARQHWGPTKPYDQAAEAFVEPPARQSTSRTPYASSGYAGSSSDSHYVTTPTSSYASSHHGYQAAPAAAAPRTQPADPYSAYQQPAGREYSGQSGYSSYSAQAQPDPYGHGRSAAPATTSYAAPRYFGYFDEQYLVYR